MKHTQYELLRTSLKAFPVLTTFGAITVAYLFFTFSESSFKIGRFGHNIVTDVILAGVLGFLGGIAVSLLGQGVLERVKVKNDIARRKRMRYSSGDISKASVIYTKADLEDNVKSVSKVKLKQEEKAKKDKAERAQVLEMGTEGMEQQRRAALGLPPLSTNKSAANNKSSIKSKSNVNNKKTKK